MSSILKLFSRFIGKTLISISVLVFITSFVILALANNIDVLKSSFDSEDILSELIDSNSELTLDEIKEICNQNPELEDCNSVQKPSLLFEEPFNELKNKIDSNTNSIKIIRIVSVIAFLIGIILLYLGTLSIYATTYKTSITILFSTLPYMLLTYVSSKAGVSSLVKSIISQPSNQELSEKLIEITINATRAWLDASIKEIKTLLITLIVISLPLTIIFYILKRKETKKSEK